MKQISLNASSFGTEEITAAIDVLKSSFVTMGKKCRQFEVEFADYLGVEEAVFVNSGSSANLLAFFALANHAIPLLPGKKRFKLGSEVIVPAVSWSTTFWPIVQSGGIPVLVDVDPGTFQIDVESARAAISDNTAAICPVHVLGNAAPLDELLQLSEEHGLWLVEDTCEALGVRYKEKYVGTFGDFGTFSFFFSHHITTIEGGMVVTRNPELAELLRCMRAHGWTRDLKNRHEVEAKYPDLDPHYLFVNTGFNLRPTELNAAFGLIQLRKLQEFNRVRGSIASTWDQRFQPLIADGVFRPMAASPHARTAWFGYPVICRDQHTRNSLKKYLNSRHIETRPIICGNMARQPAMQHITHRISGSLLGAESIMNCGLLWGLHPMMSAEDVNYIAEVVLEFPHTL